MRITSPLSSLTRRKRTSNLEEINSILDIFPSAVLYVDGDDQNVLLANTKASELSAYTRSELVNLSLAKLFIQLDLTSILSHSPLEQSPVPLTLVKRNSALVDVLVQFQKVSAQENTLLVSLQPASDFHKRQQARERFEMLLDELRSLITATQMGELQTALEVVLDAGHGLTAAPHMAIYLADSNRLKLSRIASRGNLFPEQLPPKDLIQLNTPLVWEPGVRPTSTLHSLARANGMAYLATAPIGDPNATVGLFVAADQRTTPSEDILAFIQILSGVLQNAIQYFHQIDHLQRDLDAQLRFRRFSETAQGALQDVLIVTSPDFRVATINHSAELVLGYTEQEARSMPLKDILIGSESLQTALQMAQDGIQTLNQDSIRLYRRSGEAFLARVSTLPVIAAGQVEGIIILIQDLTEQEDAKAHAEQLKQQALLGTVTAIFAHEVRNPINSISTGLQLMAYNLQPNDPQQEQITRMQQDCDRLEEMMKSVLAFSRSTEYELEPVDLGSLVSRILERMRPRMTAVKVTHRVNVEHNAPLVLGNPRALEQVFTNLFNNAIQAMEEKGGVLAVKVQLGENTGKRKHALVIVADSGPGIPKEIQDKIFTPFFTTKASGTGLGLAISQRIVTAHKGIILLNSFPGGTVFTVKIPAMQQELDEA